MPSTAQPIMSPPTWSGWKWVARAPTQRMPSAVEDVEEIVDGVGRVDDHRLAGRPVADQVDEVDHLPGELVTNGEVAAGQQLPEVQAVAVGRRSRWTRCAVLMARHHTVRVAATARTGQAHADVRAPPAGAWAEDQRARRYHARRGRSDAGAARGTHVTTDQAQSAEGTGLHTPAGMLRHWASECPMLRCSSMTRSRSPGPRCTTGRGGPSQALLAEGSGPGRSGRLPRPEQHRVLRGSLRCLTDRGGDGPGQLASGPDRDGGHHRRRRRRHLFFGSDYDGARKEIATERCPDVRTWVTIDELHDWRDRMSAGEASDPGFEPAKERAGHPALHLGHDGPSQGCGAVGPAISSASSRRPTRSSTSARTWSPWWPCPSSTSAAPAGRLAALSRGGACGDPPRPPAGRSARRHRAAPNHARLPRPGRAQHRCCRHPRWPTPTSARCASSSTGPLPSATTCWCGPCRLRMQLRPGLRVDRDDRGHHHPVTRGP